MKPHRKSVSTYCSFQRSGSFPCPPWTTASPCWEQTHTVPIWLRRHMPSCSMPRVITDGQNEDWGGKCVRNKMIYFFLLALSCIVIRKDILLIETLLWKFCHDLYSRCSKPVWTQNQKLRRQCWSLLSMQLQWIGTFKLHKGHSGTIKVVHMTRALLKPYNSFAWKTTLKRLFIENLVNHP